MADDRRHPVDTAFGLVLALAGVVFGAFVLWWLFLFAASASSDW